MWSHQIQMVHVQCPRFHPQPLKDDVWTIFQGAWVPLALRRVLDPDPLGCSPNRLCIDSWVIARHGRTLKPGSRCTDHASHPGRGGTAPQCRSCIVSHSECVRSNFGADYPQRIDSLPVAPNMKRILAVSLRSATRLFGVLSL